MRFEWLVPMLLLGWASTAGAAPPGANAALVTQLQGEVFYRPPVEEAPPAPVQPFMKARTGDVYTVGKGATLRLVYLLTGRQEVWTGPAELEIGRKASVSRSEIAPVVSKLPEASTKSLRRLPHLLKRTGTTRLGVSRVRGEKEAIEWRDEDDLSKREQKELSQARETFEKLRKDLGPSDPTPDFYLIGTLARLRVKALLISAVEDARTRFPKDATLLKLHRWLVPPPPKNAKQPDR